MRAVGALPSTHLEQPVLARRVQHPPEQPIHGRVAQQPAAELAQHAAVKARVAQVKGQQVLPVDPGTHRVCRLPVTQPFAELHQRHQRKPLWRIGGLAALGIEVGEVGVSEQGAKPVAQDQAGVATAERGAGDTGGVVGHGRCRRVRAGSAVAGEATRGTFRAENCPTPPAPSGSRIRHQINRARGAHHHGEEMTTSCSRRRQLSPPNRPSRGYFLSRSTARGARTIMARK